MLEQINIPNGITPVYIRPGELPAYNFQYIDLNHIQLVYYIDQRSVVFKDQEAIDNIHIKIREDIKLCVYDDHFYYSGFSIHEDKDNRRFIIQLDAYCKDEVIKL